MIAALLLAFLYMMSGGPGAQFGELVTAFAKDQLKANVHEEARRDRALHALKGLDKEIEALNEQVAKDVDRFETLVKDYGSTPEDFDRLFEATSARHRQQVDRLWDARTALLQEVHADEWDRILTGARADAAKKAAKEKKK